MDNMLSEISLKYKTSGFKRQKVDSPSVLHEIFTELYDGDTIGLFEEGYVLFTKSLFTTGFIRLSTGGINGTVMDVRLIMAMALISGSTGIVIAHNHPSGNMTPSESDKNVTDKLKQCCSYHDIQLIDHIILSGCDDKYFSFAEEGLL